MTNPSAAYRLIVVGLIGSIILILAVASGQESYHLENGTDLVWLGQPR
jgi:hypothetical protein